MKGREVVVQAMEVTMSASAVVMPAGHDAVFQPSRVRWPLPNHNPALNAAKIAKLAAASQIHLALSMPSDCGA